MNEDGRATITQARRKSDDSEPSLINLFPRGDQNIDCYFQPEMIAIPNTTVLVAIAEVTHIMASDMTVIVNDP